MAHSISVIIPNYNGAATLKRCLGAALASNYPDFEIIVVDDCSEDNSVEIIKNFPCRLIVLEKHAGAAAARNVGAMHSRGDILFFTDADCVLTENCLTIAAAGVANEGGRTIIGGTYTRQPYDRGFFSTFQSVFIHYSETKNCANPDYLATHALVLARSLFEKSGGFAENFLPILEDVEFSHRLKKAGWRLRMNPDLLVRHIFSYSLTKSFRNAIKKSSYWTLYSIRNHDLTADSGTASVALKLNVLCFFPVLVMLAAACYLHRPDPALVAAILICANIWINRDLLRAWYETDGPLFAFLALGYYTVLYPLAVGSGALFGIGLHLAGKYR